MAKDRAFVAPLVLLLLLACHDRDQPVVMVGSLPFPEASFMALGEPERRALADLTGFAVAVSREELDELGAPLVERAALIARLQELPYHLGAMDAGLDEAVLRAAYDRDPEWELVVRHVVRLTDVGASLAERDSARAVAALVAGAAMQGEDFGGLAARYSEEVGAARRGGLLQPGRQGSWVEPFWNAAISLNAGETSGVVETEYGFHVLRLDDRRPVPFEQADRGRVLRQLVSREAAIVAVEEWSAAFESLGIDDVLVYEAARRLIDGSEIPAAGILARGWHDGGEYLGADLAAGWAALRTDERLLLERTLEAVEDWIRRDAEEIVMARAAESLGVRPSPLVAADAERQWRGTAAGWASALGFRPGMSDQQIGEAVMAALLSGAPELRSVRAELRSLRPLLRQRYTS